MDTTPMRLPMTHVTPRGNDDPNILDPDVHQQIVAKDTKLRLNGRKWPSLKNSRLLIKGEMKFEFP